MMVFKFRPQEYVYIPSLDCTGRVNRCILDSGNMPLYQVCYFINGDQKYTELLEDELEKKDGHVHPRTS